MKEFLMIMAVLVLASTSSPSLAAEKDEKGPSQSAYEHASERSVFNRIGDWFSTVGKSEEEKGRIMEERKARRSSRRTDRDADRVRDQAEVPAERAEGDTGRAKEKIKGKADKKEKKAKKHGQELEDIDSAILPVEDNTNQLEEDSGRVKDVLEEAEDSTEGEREGRDSTEPSDSAGRRPAAGKGRGKGRR